VEDDDDDYFEDSTLIEENQLLVSNELITAFVQYILNSMNKKKQIFW
jgi:hypothetical protein